MSTKRGEVDLALIRDLVLWLRSKVNLKWASADSYQSAMLLQAFRTSGIRSGILSVDTSMDPYAELKQAIRDKRFLFKSDILFKELRELEKTRGKVNHPKAGSKDVSDAAAGVVWILYQKESRRRISGRSSASRRKLGRGL